MDHAAKPIMSPQDSPQASDRAQPRVRAATLADQDQVSRFFEAGREPDHILKSDAAEDVHDLSSSYLADSGGCNLWLAEDDEGELIGMVGVLAVKDSGAQMRRLRVHPDWRGQGIGTELVKNALQFCSDRGYVKVALRTQVDQDAAIALFRRFGFELSRTRVVNGNERMEFYLDLYREPEARKDRTE